MTNILLAEDDLFLREIYEEVFTNEGFTITSAVDGEEAFNKIKQGNWDLILLDIVMPKMSGVEVLNKLKENNLTKSAKHVVLMTNSDDKNEFESALPMIDGYILKSSYTPDQLVVKIKEFLNS